MPIIHNFGLLFLRACDATIYRFDKERKDLPMMPILLVDDERQVRCLIKTILAGQGFEVVEAEDGLRAFSTLQEFKGELSLIVSDVRMPSLDGISLCKQVKKGFPHIPVLLCSGDALEACGVGDGFLQKPVQPDVLIRAVRDLVADAGKVSSYATRCLSERNSTPV